MLGRRPQRAESDHGHRPVGWLGLKRTFAATLAFALLIGWGLVGEYLRSRDMQQEIDRLEARAQEMADKNRTLAVLGSTVSSEAMLEREARLKMNLQKPGEQVVVVNGASGAARTETVPAADPVAPSNAAKWWRYFFQ